jgi:Glyoxalase/Bleomycin resistance protein/Dioxygenase superfamily
MKLGLKLEFRYEDFYAGIRAGSQLIHLKLADQKDPSIEFVEEGEHFHLYLETTDVKATANALKESGVPFVKDVHDTPWGTREFVIKDDQGHTLYLGEKAFHTLVDQVTEEFKTGTSGLRTNER